MRCPHPLSHLLADQIANTRDISQNFDSVDEYVLKLQEMNEEEESRSREETEVDEEKKRREEEKERYRVCILYCTILLYTYVINSSCQLCLHFGTLPSLQGENWNIKLRMDSRLGEKQIRRLLGKNTGYLQVSAAILILIALSYYTTSNLGFLGWRRRGCREFQPLPGVPLRRAPESRAPLHHHHAPLHGPPDRVGHG